MNEEKRRGGAVSLSYWEKKRGEKMRVSIIRRLIYLFIYFFSLIFCLFLLLFFRLLAVYFFFGPHWAEFVRGRWHRAFPFASLVGFPWLYRVFFLVRNQFSSGDEVEDCTEFSSAVLPDWTPFQHRFFLRMEGPVLYRTGSTGIFWPNSDSARKVSARTMEPEPS